MQKRKNFIFKNETFVCRKCKKDNPILKKGCRNHCKFCLYSLHIDKDVPGDRKNTCDSLMEPIAVDKDGKKGYIIIHECTKCGEIRRNKAAQDDNFDEIINLSLKQS